MKTFALVGISSSLFLATPALGRAEIPGSPISDGASLDGALREHRHATVVPPAWNNPWLPQAAGQPSGDQQLMRIVSEYRRAALDRGGWVNSLMQNPRYASGNPLLTVHDGEGVTVAGFGRTGA